MTLCDGAMCVSVFFASHFVVNITKEKSSVTLKTWGENVVGWDGGLCKLMSPKCMLIESQCANSINRNKPRGIKWHRVNAFGKCIVLRLFRSFMSNGYVSQHQNVQRVPGFVFFLKIRIDKGSLLCRKTEN